MTVLTFRGGPLDGQTRVCDGEPRPLRLLAGIEPGCPMPEHVYVLYQPVRSPLGGWSMVVADL